MTTHAIQLSALVEQPSAATLACLSAVQSDEWGITTHSQIVVGLLNRISSLEKQRDIIDDFAMAGAVDEFFSEARVRPGDCWATAFESRAGEYLVEIGYAEHVEQGPPVWVYKLKFDR